MLTQHKHLFVTPFQAVARMFIALGLTPNAVTVLSLFLSILVSIYFVITENYIFFGIAMIVCGLLDAIDGTMARLTKCESRFGSYLDALTDRVFEATGIFAVAYVSGQWVLCYLIICGAMLISYTKARAAMEIPVDNDRWPDLMERTERDVIFALTTIFYGLFPNTTLFSFNLLTIGFVILTVLIYFTVLQRFRRACQLVKELDSAEQ